MSCQSFRVAPWCVALATALSFSSVGHAAPIVWDFDNPTPVSIVQISQAGGLEVGDKIFADFGVASSGNAVYQPTAAEITVSGTFLNGDYGLQFNGGWFALPGQTLDTAINFDVTVAPSGAPNLIKDAGLFMDGVMLNSLPSSFVQVQESVYAAPPVPGGHPTNLVPGEGVYANSSGEINGVDQGFILNGVPVAYPEVWVIKDIMLYGGTIPPSGIIPPGPNTAVSWITQTYSQTPEPSTFALLGVALLSLLGYAACAWRRPASARRLS